MQLQQRLRIGATGQLQGAGRRPGGQATQQSDRSACRQRAQITAHRLTIQLPERPQASGPQQTKAPPQIAGERSNPAHRWLGHAHGHSSEANPTAQQLVKPLGKCRNTARLAVQLHRIGTQRRQQGRHRLGSEHMGSLLNQAERAGSEAASAAIAALIEHTGRTGGLQTDRQGRADPFTGATALRRTATGVKPGFAKVRILTIAEADHEPGLLS